MLTAHCDLQAKDPEAVLAFFCSHYVEHAAVHRRKTAGRITLPYGRFSLLASLGGLSVRARASDETNLTYLKMGVVHHLREFMGDQTPPLRWTGDGRTGGTPSFWRDMRVVSATDVTPAMRRVVLSGRDLALFADGGFHVRLLFPPAGRALCRPVLGDDGCPIWPQGEDALTARVYTIREIDPAKGEVAIDILRHDGDATPGSAFAVNAMPGDEVGMAGPLGDAKTPLARRLFLFGDETAIPAIDRILRRLAPGLTARVVIEVTGPEEEQPLASGADLDVTWLHRGRTGTSLADAACKLTNEIVGPDGYVWAGCEFSDFTAIRRHCRKVLGLARERHLVSAYWRRGARQD